MTVRPRLLTLFVSLTCLAAGTLASPAATIALITGENEYGTAETLPAFAKAELEPLGHKIVHIAAPEKEGEHTFTNVDALPHADIVVVSVRRRAPQKELMDSLRRHLASGKPVVGIRTASHAFELRKSKPPEGHAEWPTFDTAVLGADYLGHYENKAGKGPATVVTIVPEQATHSILAGLKPTEFKFTSHLYKNTRLAPDTEVLMRGSIEGGKENEPVAWTHMAGESRVFYTSLGSKEDFESPAFRHLLKNGILWALAEGANPKWGNWVEPTFPFFSSVLDARDIPGSPKNNLTPRGLVLPLGQDCWTCIDLDLLRVAAVWRGKGVTPRAMAPGSYHAAGTKTLEGQRDLPKPDGKIWLVNGLYPGAQVGDTLTLTDPRDPTPMETEPGRGALDPAKGRFLSVRAKQGGAELVYLVAGVAVIETWSSGEGAVIERRIERGATNEPMIFALGRTAEGSEGLKVLVDEPAAAELIEVDGVRAVRVKPSDKPATIRVAIAMSGEPKFAQTPEPAPATPRWSEELATKGILSKDSAAYVLDDIPLPIDNPWRRNVRVSDLGFFKDGTAAVLTFDGDVWLVRGLDGNLENVRWKRFTSGLHEPLSLVVHQEKVMVFDRNGLWRLHDTDGNGEADEHELFSNVFAQTAETREFSNGFRAAPDGSFIISKGGQQGGSLGKHNGMVLRVSPDGKKLEVLARGLRQPFIGVHPRSGLVTASDQQGHYIPSTPLHIIGGGRFYGFMPTFLPKEQYPDSVVDPLTWIPHSTNASAANQVWLVDAKMGPLNDALIHIGYNRPELFLVRMHERASRPQAAVISIEQDIPFGLLGGTVNPRDGQLYVAGFKVFGCSAPRISGLARMRYTGAPSTFPREVVAMNEGMLLRFDEPLDEASVSPANFVVQRWNYRRSAQYGSPHLKLDGSPGQEIMTSASAYLSKDRKAVFVGVPDMKPVMQMTLYWKLASNGVPFERSAVFTPHELVPFNPTQEEFAPITVDLTSRPAPAPAMAAASAVEPSATEGRKLYEMLGCIACHSTDGSMAGKVGPSWRGLAGARREMSDGSKVLVDEAYLRESILQPSAKVPKGFQNLDAGMPIYEGVLNEAQLRSLILYIQSLGELPTVSAR